MTVGAGADARAARLSRTARLALAFAAGGVMALGQSPFEIWPAVFLAWPAAILLARAGSPGWVGWLFGAGYFTVALHWIVEPFMVDAARHGLLAPFALIGLAAGLALFWGGAFWIAFRAAGGRPWPQIAALAVALSVAEFARSTILTGFPWALPAQIWSTTPVFQALAWFGPHGLGLITLLAAGLVAMRRPLPAALAAAAIAALWAGGAARLASTDVAPGPDAPVIRLVQPNAAQHLKWRADMIREFYEAQISATQAPADRRPAAVVWPETAVPFALGDRPDLEADIAAAAGPGTTAILGILRRPPDGSWTNGLVALGPGGTVRAVYDKHHLVPFGEYIPFDEWPPFSWLTGLAGSFDAGPGPARLAVAGLPPFQPLICYEAIFPHEILRGAARADWLLQVTNDAWFGRFSGPYQHLAIARMRAVEQGLPLARAANTGVSAMIDPLGRVTGALALGERGHLDAALPPPLPPTPYARLGEIPFLCLLLALGAAAWLALRRRRHGV